MDTSTSARKSSRRKKAIVDFIDGSSDIENQDIAIKNITSRKRKKTTNPTIAQFVVPEIGVKIVDLGEFLEGQEQFDQQNNSSSVLTASQNLEIVIEYVNESQSLQNDNLLDQESVLNPTRQDEVFLFQGEDDVSGPPKKRTKVLNPTPFYDTVNTASQGSTNFMQF